jgi:hypothetical protein
MQKGGRKSKSVKLTKTQIISGVDVSHHVEIEGLPLHKLKKEVLSEVEFGRKAFVVTLQGKDRALLLPLPA